MVVEKAAAKLRVHYCIPSHIHRIIIAQKLPLALSTLEGKPMRTMDYLHGVFMERIIVQKDYKWPGPSGGSPDRCHYCNSFVLQLYNSILLYSYSNQ
jgi:hypothetical protein